MKEYKFTINGHDYTVTVGAIEGNQASVNVNGTDYQVTLPSSAASSVPAARPVAAAAPAPAAASTPAPAAAGAGSVVAPLPGVVLSIAVKPGDVVKASDPVVVLEAMKMENAIPAGRDGKVIAVNVKEGESVLEGATLVTLG
ncbi:MAG: acetyl-CoA carboxylase biotin carboxyl carrier protein subunit [Muribaculaceae bacterium]|nr:acetyl-CoA carboxylase biotin carboxyl carrier protein subunit [Muribaculaceae bacterium]